MSAFQLMFLLGWLDMRSRVLVILVAPASATFAALFLSSSIAGSVRVCRRSQRVWIELDAGRGVRTKDCREQLRGSARLALR